MTSLKTSIKTITYLSDTGCLEIQGASLHLHRYPKFNRISNVYGKSLVKYLTMRLDDETNKLLIAAKNRSGWCKTDEAADRVIDHLIKFPDFYNSEIYREATEQR
ncbi:TraY domain-containing protein [Escherichia coli]|nr:TraY domain-containing protein [Escherichia coli]